MGRGSDWGTSGAYAPTRRWLATFAAGGLALGVVLARREATELRAPETGARAAHAPDARRRASGHARIATRVVAPDVVRRARDAGWTLDAGPDALVVDQGSLGVVARLDGGGATLVGGQLDGAVRIAAAQLGRGGSRRSLPDGVLDVGACEADESVPAGDDCLRPFSTERGPVTETWHLRDEGLEHVLTVRERPEGSGDLELTLAVRGAPVALSSNGVDATFDPPGKGIVLYSGLAVRDGAGLQLPAHFEADGVGLTVVIDDAHATYPVVIDPLVTTVAWRYESDVLMAALGGQVRSAGDVNGDGYGDLLATSYGWDNVEADEGKVWVFHGDRDGAGTAPVWSFETNVATARLGWAASAGDIDGDGYGDLIAGAPTYDNPEKDEGAFYVFHGSATGLEAAPRLIVEGNLAEKSLGYQPQSAGDVNADGYSDVVVCALGDTGVPIAGTLYIYKGSATGLVTTPYFSVSTSQSGCIGAAAGDVDSDGYDDILLGMPTYTGGNLYEGRARLYRGTASGMVLSTTWTGGSLTAYLGNSVAPAGDVNADGFADILVDAPYLANGSVDEGRQYLYLGASPTPVATPFWAYESNTTSAGLGAGTGLGDLNGDGFADVAIQYATSTQYRIVPYFGATAAMSAGPTLSYSAFPAFGLAGDVNGDGFADLVVGEITYTNGQSGEGAISLRLGRGDPPTAAARVTVEADQASSSFGTAIAGLDFDADGFDDFAVGAKSYDDPETTEGAVFLYRGSATGPTAAGILEMNQAYGDFGCAVADAGDVNGDGFEDLVVGAKRFDDVESNEGLAFLYLGSATGPETMPSWRGQIDQVSGNFGSGVASAGDVNADGYSDVLVGASLFDNGQLNEGRVTLYLGSASGLESVAAWSFESDVASAQLGDHLAGVGDVDGDGYGDVVVAAPLLTASLSQQGRAWFFRGTATGLSTTPTWTVQGDEVGDQLGTSISRAGDVDSDGYADVVLGGPSSNENGTAAGFAYVYRGSPSGPSSTPSVMLYPGRTNSYFGNAVDSAGDFDGDGFGDLIVGAYQFDNGNTDAGGAFFYRGSSTGIVTTPVLVPVSTVVTENFGVDVAGIGDIDGDGFDDVAVGAANYTNGQAFEGAVHVYYGGGVLPLVAGTRHVTTVETPSTEATAPWNRMAADAIGVTLTTRSVLGRTLGFVEAEAKIRGTPFDGLGPYQAASGDLAGTVTGSVVVPLVPFEDFHVRARLRYDLVRAPLQVGGPWVELGLPGDAPGVHVRSRAGALGDTCRSHANCASGFCVDGVCCDGACGGGAAGDCQACSVAAGAAADGTCGVVSATAAYVCRAAASGCDVAETCDGVGLACPTDGFVPYNPGAGVRTECRPKDPGINCDAAEYCNGAGACPPDAVAVVSTQCRPAAGICDLEETCDGVTDVCPGDSRVASGTVCRPSVGACDVADVCDGTSTACSADVFLPAGTVCDIQNGICDAVDVCTGNSGACPELYAPAGVQCDTAHGPCDSADYCSGSSTLCPEQLLPDGTTCDDGRSCTGNDVCTGGNCGGTNLPSGTLCRASAGACDTPETCTGTAGDCPVDRVAVANTVCRAAAGTCDVVEACDGTSPACPGDARLASGTVCRPAVGFCDVADTCDGSSAQCAPDAFKPAGTICDVANGLCDAVDYCDGASGTCPELVAPAGLPCDTAHGACDAPDACDGVATTCPETLAADGTACDDGRACTGSDACTAGACGGVTLAAGVVCRAPAGACDLAESCDGSTSDCPADGVAAANTVCRAAAGTCDVAESCDGTSTACPGDIRLSNGTVCRPASGACDVADVCDGASPSCGADLYKPAGVVCDVAYGVCDAIDYCTGSSPTCPEQYATAGTPCDGAHGDCDAPDVCDGTSDVCPELLAADGTTCDDGHGCTDNDACASGACAGTVVTAGTECRAANGACDVAESCDGAAIDCPVNAVAPANTVCRAAAGTCDVAESCDGNSPACPGDAKLAGGTICRPAVGTCDVADVCDGASPTCAPDALKPAGTVCDGASGACDATDFCDGATGTCPEFVLPAGTPCDVARGKCDAADFCNGIDFTCPETFQPDGTQCDDDAGCTGGDTCTNGICAGALMAAGEVCRPSVGACDGDEVCDGVARTCPLDVVAAAGTECRSSTGPCDPSEVCDGNGGACPGDTVAPAGTSCRPAAPGEPCDAPEYCDGAAKACPADAVRPSTYLCGLGTGVCDIDDYCDGVAKSCADQLRADGSYCDDSDVCTAASDCRAGVCTPKVTLDCSDGDDCTTDLCLNPIGCTHEPVPACLLDAGVTRDAGPVDSGAPIIIVQQVGCSCRTAGSRDEGRREAMLAFVFLLAGAAWRHRRSVNGARAASGEQTHVLR